MMEVLLVQILPLAICRTLYEMAVSCNIMVL